jgi:hypothetical protein
MGLSSANGQSERMIQTFELGLIILLGARLDTGDWELAAAHVIHCMNISTSATTKQVPYEVLYGRRAKSFLPISHDIGDTFGEAQQTLRQEALDAIALAQTKMKIYYDDKRVPPPTLSEKDWVYVKLAQPGDHYACLDEEVIAQYLVAGEESSG